MSKNTAQKGFAHLLILILIFAGIGTGVYLMSSKDNFFTQLFPKAGGGVGVFWVDDQGDETIESTTDATLRVRLAPPWPYANIVVDQLIEATEAELDTQLNSQAKSKDKKIKMVRVKGRFTFPKEIKADKLPDPPTIFSTCTNSNVVYSKNRTSFAFEVPEKSSFCVQASNPQGYAVLAINAKQGPSSFYKDQVAGIDCSNKKVKCDTQEKVYDLSNDKKYDFRYRVAKEPTPSPTPQEVKTLKVVLAEDPNFITNVVEISYFGIGSTIIEYPFSDTTPGVKLVYAKFIGTNGEVQVFKDLVELLEKIPPPTRAEFLVKPYLVYPADKPQYPEYETAVKKYMLELQVWYKEKVGITFEMTPLQVKTSSYNYDIMRCDLNPYDAIPPTSECLNDPKKLDGNWGQYMNLAIHSGIEKWDERTATLVFSAGGGGYAGANLYPNYAGWAISGDWVLEPLSGVANSWGIPCSLSDGWQCSGGVPGGSPAHELGHAFGLPHPDSIFYPGEKVSIMRWHGDYPEVGFLPHEVVILKQSPFFTGIIPSPSPSSSPSPTPSPTPVPPTPTPTPATQRFVRIISPNGGETFKVGETARISWEGSGNQVYRVGYSLGSGSLNWIAFALNTDTRFYDWTVSVGNTANTQFKIVIFGDNSGNVLRDESDNFFTVNP